MKNLFRITYQVTNKLHASRAFLNTPPEYGGGLRGVKKGDVLTGIGIINGDWISITWDIGAASHVAMEIATKAFVMEEIIEVTKEDLINIMDDSYRQIGWKDTSYRLCEFIGIDPTDGV